jgi:hypothetical protein
MYKPCNLFVFLFTFFITLTSCSHSIKIDITRQSSELNHCENIFGNDLNTLKTENAILLQTGEIDTTDEKAPIQIAIVIIEKKEIILKLIHHIEVASATTREYVGEGYKLNLYYVRQISEQNDTTFIGNFLIEFKSIRSRYDIEGTTCNL